ncbi:MAG: hypothetical protein HC897_08350 [Thermoanaerobaculia bacterium]|nr:hypothetical protein [Thermoanaerobaculia bacterium]
MRFDDFGSRSGVSLRFPPSGAQGITRSVTDKGCDFPARERRRVEQAETGLQTPASYVAFQIEAEGGAELLAESSRCKAVPAPQRLQAEPAFEDGFGQLEQSGAPPLWGVLGFEPQALPSLLEKHAAKGCGRAVASIPSVFSPHVAPQLVALGEGERLSSEMRLLTDDHTNLQGSQAGRPISSGVSGRGGRAMVARVQPRP